MAPRLAAFNSLAALRSSASTWPPGAESRASGTLHAGHRLAKPGLSGFSSNSSEQMTQVLTGNDIFLHGKCGPIDPSRDTRNEFPMRAFVSL
jgi:hypothetical protein